MSPEPRILITGASGFVGTWLVRALHTYDDFGRVQVVTAGRGGGCDVDTDVKQRSQTDRLVRDVRPTALVHLAAIAAPAEARKDPLEAWETNFDGTRNMALSVMAEQPDCRFVFAGSSEAYGYSFADLEGVPILEDTVLKPMSTYGATKAAADIMLGQMHFDGLRAVRFRPFNHTGPGQSDAYVVPAFASQIARVAAGVAKPVIKVGNLSARRDVTDVRDIVRAYAIAALDLLRPIDGMVFNLASGNAVSIEAILRTLIDTSGIEIAIEQDPERMRPVDIPIASGDARAAMKHLGWAPTIELSRTVLDVMQDWRSRTRLP